MIAFNDETLVILGRSSETLAQLRWADVQKVVAFKRDAVIVDLICMWILTDQVSVEINEEMHGWNAVTNELPQLLPGAVPHNLWWHKVSQQPFAANLTVLYTRSPAVESDRSVGSSR